MGEQATTGTLYQIAKIESKSNGSLTLFTFGEFTFDGAAHESLNPLEPMAYSVEISGKHLRCKSRRRYVKLLMGNGWSRNAANKNARRRRDEGMSYRQAWFLHWFEEPF